jgi:hypothetical protein
MSYHEFLILHVHHAPPPTVSTSFFNLTSNNQLERYADLLNLGMKHIPIPADITNDEITSSLTRFVNKTGWKAHFQRHRDPDDDSKFEKAYMVKKLNPKPYSFHHPDDKQLRELLGEIEGEFASFGERKSRVKSRLSTELKLLRRFLISNPDIKFVATDKNLGFCALPISVYNDLVLSHLTNPRQYQLVSNNTNIAMLNFHTTLRSRFTGALDLIRQNLENTDQLTRYLHSKQDSSYTLPYFHVLPKVHKGIANLTARPIVGAVNWYTTPISIILDVQLKPFLGNYPAILRNSNELTDFLDSFVLPPNATLIVIDLVALYSNIRVDLATRDVANLDPILGSLSSFIMNSNYFQYDGRVFKQTNGIAMGTNVAPTIANIYLGCRLDPFLLAHPNVKLYKRFLDDLLIVFTGDGYAYSELDNDLAQLVPGLSHTMSNSQTSVDFLDLKIMMIPGCKRLHYSTHQKALNKYAYISPKSTHPLHTFRGFIKGELTRYARNSSLPHYYEHTKRKFYLRLRQRGYSHHMLYPVFQNHTWANRVKITSSKPSTVLPVVFPYTLRSGFDVAFQRVKKFKSRFHRWFPNSRFMPVYSRTSNLSQHITKSGLTNAQRILLSEKNNSLFPNTRCSERRNTWSRWFPPPPPPTTKPHKPHNQSLGMKRRYQAPIVGPSRGKRQKVVYSNKRQTTPPTSTNKRRR